MAKAERAEGAFRVGLVTDWKKPDKENAPRRCKVAGEWIKVWPEKTTGWKDKQPIKAPNEALRALGQIASGEDAGTVTAFIPGYEQRDEYGVTFYAEGEPTIPAPEGSIPRYILSADGPKAAGSGGGSGDSAALVAAVHMQTIVNAQAAAVDLAKVPWDEYLDLLSKVAGTSAPAATEAPKPQEEQKDEVPF